MTVFVAVGEVSMRFFVADGYITPEVLRKQSVQYEPSIFSRYVFPPEARTIIHPWGMF